MVSGKNRYFCIVSQEVLSKVVAPFHEGSLADMVASIYYVLYSMAAILVYKEYLIKEAHER